MSYHRYLRSMGKAWVPTTMELIRDGIYDPAWYERLETYGWSPIFGGVIVDTQHDAFDESWLSVVDTTKETG